MVYFTLFELLLPHASGRVEFSTELTSPIVWKEGPPATEDFGAHVLEMMTGYSLFTHHFEKTGSALAELEIDAQALEATPYHDVSFSMAKMARLPGLNPETELQELRGLFESLKPFFLTHAAAMPRITVSNYRDDSEQTYGLLDWGIRDATPEETAEAQAASDEAMRRIKASPILDAWLRQLALDLDKIGPYSWYTLQDEHFFPMEENPVMEYLRNNPAPGKSSSPRKASGSSSNYFITTDGRRGRKKNTGKRHVFL